MERYIWSWVFSLEFQNILGVTLRTSKILLRILKKFSAGNKLRFTANAELVSFFTAAGTTQSTFMFRAFVYVNINNL